MPSFFRLILPKTSCWWISDGKLEQLPRIASPGLTRIAASCAAGVGQEARNEKKWIGCPRRGADVIARRGTRSMLNFLYLARADQMACVDGWERSGRSPTYRAPGARCAWSPLSRQSCSTSRYSCPASSATISRQASSAQPWPQFQPHSPIQPHPTELPIPGRRNP